ncbi:hypothetical protein MNBD_UNCLBAC01-516 [hydrothermal vent metagenome]|uniref:Glycosyltransferase 2-like domain-containing protein n=1 Tax=hydrothermal vent metagenome TaxID=652676 RepID=A0A3B1CYJ8_9ZZZZ
MISRGLFMAEPIITILMTVYNGEKYLKDSIESILKQTYQDFEFLIINDKSTDNSADIINSFNDFRINIVTNDKNIGQTCSLNKGLKLAKGKYIARMDADDKAFPYWLEHQLNFIKKNPEYTVVSTKASVMDVNNRITKILNSPQSYQEIILKCLVGSPINHVGSLFKKDIILECGGYDENFKIAADYDLWSRLIRGKYKFACIDTIGVAVRVHEQSISIIEKENKTDLLEMSKIMRANIQCLTQKNISDEQAKLLWRLVYSVGSLNKGEFGEANKILKNIYAHMHSSLGISFNLALNFRKKMIKVFYIKRVFNTYPWFSNVYRWLSEKKAKFQLKRDCLC